eukprot:m51a1_g14419 hypothetical protein (1161) ;mRNA; f:478317-484320
MFGTRIFKVSYSLLARGVWRPSTHDRVWVDGVPVAFDANPNYARLPDVPPGSVFAFTAAYRSDGLPASPVIHHDGLMYDVSSASCSSEVAGEWYARDYEWEPHRRMPTSIERTPGGAHYWHTGSYFHRITRNLFCRAQTPLTRSLVAESCEYRWDESYRAWGAPLTFVGRREIMSIVGLASPTDGAEEAVVMKAQASFWNEDRYSLVIEHRFHTLRLAATTDDYLDFFAVSNGDQYFFTAPSFLPVADRNSTTFANRLRGQFLDEPRGPSCLRVRACINSLWNGTHCVCRPGYEDSGEGCSECPLGTYKRSAGRSSCIRCPVHSTTLNTGSTRLADCVCEANYGGNAREAGCYRCIGGSKYSVEDGPCTGCVDNAEASPSLCQCRPGFGGDASLALPGANCTACPPQTYKALAGNEGCTACPVGSYAPTAASTGCLCEEPNTVFHEGRCVCLLGFVERQGRCVECPADTYRDSLSLATCTACPPHSTTLGLNGSSSVLFCACDGGMGADGRSMCTVIRVDGRFFGLEQNVTMQVAVSEASRTSDQPILLSISGAPSAGLIVALMAHIDARGIEGRTVLGNQDVVVMERPLSQWPARGFTASLRMVPRSDSCSCPENHYISDSACVPCPAGSTRPTSSSGRQGCLCGDANAVWSAGQCLCAPGQCLCAPGMTAGAGGLCIECPQGTWKGEAGNGPCNACPPHSNTSTAAQTSQTACQCLADHGGDASEDRGCAPCQGGSKPVGNGPCNCLSPLAEADASGTQCQCAAGSEGDALRGPDGCTPCSPGSFKAAAGNTQCVKCPEHSVASGVASEQCACAEGYGGDATTGACHMCVGSTKTAVGNFPCVCNDSNAVDIDGTCVCAAGFEGGAASGGPGPCTPCPAGTYKGGAGSDRCMQCPEHSTTLAGGQTIIVLRGYHDVGGRCSQCPLGTFKAAAGLGPCTSCAEGATTLSTGATSRAACQCVAGFEGDASADWGACGRCAPGLFKHSVGNTMCSACPAGATSSAPGSTSRSECVCAPGMRGDASVEGGACTACPAGTFKSAGNGGECALCPGNSTSAEGAEACWCLAGFQPDSNSAAMECSACPQGSYKSGVGNGACTPCGQGTTSEAGATMELQCAVSLSGSLVVRLALLCSIVEILAVPHQNCVEGTLRRDRRDHRGQ